MKSHSGLKELIRQGDEKTKAKPVPVQPVVIKAIDNKTNVDTIRKMVQERKKKIIDVMYFSGKNKIKFGLPIFKKSKDQSQKRVILEYDAKTLISVKYNEKEKQIIFDHLVPSRKDLEGIYEYYIPEGTFNSYNYKHGRWWLKQDVDIRNTQKIPKFNRPKRGLIPR